MSQYSFSNTEKKLTIFKQNLPIFSINRDTLQPLTPQPTNENNEKLNFQFILGIFKYHLDKSTFYFIVFVTDTKWMNFYNVYKIEDFEIVQINKKQTEDTLKFQNLLERGLNQCSMYYSDTSKDTYNIKFTFQQQFENHNSRECFVWNNEAIKCLKDFWPNVECYREVIGGYFSAVGPFAIIARKCNKNGGCHTWNRGADVNGNPANFVESEEIIILNDGSQTSNQNNSDENDQDDQNQNNQNSTYNNLNSQSELDLNESGMKRASFKSSSNSISAASHVEISGSCPLFWSQYPTMEFSRPFHFGPEQESKRRFDLHFKALKKIYINGDGDSSDSGMSQNPNSKQENAKSLVIVSLLGDRGKEKKLNELYSKFSKEENLNFTAFKFSRLMKTQGALTSEISALTEMFDAFEIADGNIKSKQTVFPRVNCTSCLDRTSVFMEISFASIFDRIYSRLFRSYNNVRIHKNIWIGRANALADEYAISRGMKLYLMENDVVTFAGKFNDYLIQADRFVKSIFIEGRNTDAYNAVLQERPFSKFENVEIFRSIIMFFQLVLLFVYLLIFEGKTVANLTWRKRIKSIINHPHMDDLRDADEYDNLDFFREVVYTTQNGCEKDLAELIAQTVGFAKIIDIASLPPDFILDSTVKGRRIVFVVSSDSNGKPVQAAKPFWESMSSLNKTKVVNLNLQFAILDCTETAAQTSFAKNLESKLIEIGGVEVCPICTCDGLNKDDEKVKNWINQIKF